MSSTNPVFNEKTLSKISEIVREGDQAMTVHGAINKTGILILITILSSCVSWGLAETPMGSMISIVGLVLNLILSFVIVFKKEKSPVLAPVFAVAEGLSLGFISYWTNTRYPGIAVNAMILTFAAVVLMLGLYHYRIIRVTEKFKAVMMAAILSIGVTYIVDLVMMLFGSSIGFIHQSSTFGIVFSVIVVGVAAMSLLLDFDMIEKAAEARAPKWMEWYSGFAVLVTIVWLYLEILRLLSKANSRK